MKINEEKTEYMTSRVNENKHKHFQIENFNFETVQSFAYLGSLINVNNDNSADIKKIILLTNKRLLWIRETI